jgi:hypothetical protein
VMDVDQLADWMPVAGFEGKYRVSRLGAIERCMHSFARAGGTIVTYPAKPLKTQSMQRGHQRVILHKGGKRSIHFLHHLVLLSFGYLRPSPSSVVRHLDGNPHNNALDNLTWGTHQENAIDACFHGTTLKKLSINDMRAIRAAFAKPYHGQSADLARKYGVDPSSISNVKRGRTGHYVI